MRSVVHNERAWTARTGRATMLAKKRARLNEVDHSSTSARRTMKQRQDSVHPKLQQQQHPASGRREPTLVDPLAARGTNIKGEQRQLRVE